MYREEPNLEDYLAAGALANVPLWIHLLILTYTSDYFQYHPAIFFTLIPVAAMIAGGSLASILLCRRSSQRFLRIGFIVGLVATIVNIVFGVAASGPSMAIVAPLCFFAGSVVAAILWQRRGQVIADLPCPIDGTQISIR